jgi:hypothetical protein
MRVDAEAGAARQRGRKVQVAPAREVLVLLLGHQFLDEGVGFVLRDDGLALHGDKDRMNPEERRVACKDMQVARPRIDRASHQVFDTRQGRFSYSTGR